MVSMTLMVVPLPLLLLRMLTMQVVEAAVVESRAPDEPNRVDNVANSRVLSPPPHGDAVPWVDVGGRDESPLPATHLVDNGLRGNSLVDHDDDGFGDDDRDYSQPWKATTLHYSD